MVSKRTAYDLEGRLHRVHIERIVSSYSSLGLLGNQEVLVENGNNYVGNDCLVVFRNMVSESEQKVRSKFITSDISQIPDVYLGYGPEEYILCGLWKSSMNKREDYPTFSEILNYFDPGFISFFIYIGSRNTKDKYTISKGRRINLDGTINQIIRKSLPDPQKSSRVIITETSRDLDNVMDKIQKQEMKVIRMELLC